MIDMRKAFDSVKKKRLAKLQKYGVEPDASKLIESY